jgi:hypothetical protein
MVSATRFRVSIHLASTPVSEPRRLRQHRPTLLQREDDRWEVRCPQCRRSSAEATPIGIGLPIESQVEAEWIAQNHAGAVARRAEVA